MTRHDLEKIIEAVSDAMSASVPGLSLRLAVEKGSEKNVRAVSLEATLPDGERIFYHSIVTLARTARPNGLVWGTLYDRILENDGWPEASSGDEMRLKLHVMGESFAKKLALMYMQKEEEAGVYVYAGGESR